MKEERQRPRSGRLQALSRGRYPRDRIPILRQQAVEPAGQGEVLVTWAVWGLVALAVLATYSRLEPAELYNVSEDGLAGGLGRTLVLLDFPVALVAVAVALVSAAVLPRAAWWAAGPAIALCAVVPAVVDQDDLNAGWGNALPALGVLVVLALTVAATRRVGTAFAPSSAAAHGSDLLEPEILREVDRAVRKEAARRRRRFVLARFCPTALHGIPSALVPGPRPVWVAIVVLAVLATIVLVRENDRVETAPAI